MMKKKKWVAFAAVLWMVFILPTVVFAGGAKCLK